MRSGLPESRVCRGRPSAPLSAPAEKQHGSDTRTKWRDDPAHLADSERGAGDVRRRATHAACLTDPVSSKEEPSGSLESSYCVPRRPGRCRTTQVYIDGHHCRTAVARGHFRRRDFASSQVRRGWERNPTLLVNRGLRVRVPSPAPVSVVAAVGGQGGQSRSRNTPTNSGDPGHVSTPRREPAGPRR